MCVWMQLRMGCCEPGCTTLICMHSCWLAYAKIAKSQDTNVERVSQQKTLTERVWYFLFVLMSVHTRERLARLALDRSLGVRVHCGYHVCMLVFMSL